MLWKYWFLQFSLKTPLLCTFAGPDIRISSFSDHLIIAVKFVPPKYAYNIEHRPLLFVSSRQNNSSSRAQKLRSIVPTKFMESSRQFCSSRRYLFWCWCSPVKNLSRVQLWSGSVAVKNVDGVVVVEVKNVAVVIIVIAVTLLLDNFFGTLSSSRNNKSVSKLRGSSMHYFWREWKYWTVKVNPVW